jgi:hypothetical protein
VYCQTRLKELTRFPVDKMVDNFGDNPHVYDFITNSSNRNSKKLLVKIKIRRILNFTEARAGV